MYDVIVIGGGIVGISTAYELVRSGARTLVIDRRDQGRATDAGAGIISPGGNIHHHDPYYRFVGMAEAYYTDLNAFLREDGASETGYAVCGSLFVAVDAREGAEFVRATAGFPKGEGRDPERPEVVSADRARALFPPLDSVTGALFSPTAARVDGRQLAAALEAAAVGRGLDVKTRSVRVVRAETGHVRLVLEDGEELSAGHVVIAGGAWSRSFSEQLGVVIPVGPQRGQILHLDVGETDTSGWPIITGMGEHYMVPWPDHRVVVGATREASAGFNAVTTVEGLMEVMREATRVAPGLRTASLREIRVGLRPLSQDGMPVIGRLPGHERVHVVTGHGPMGLHLGPFSGKVTAEAVLGNNWPSEWAGFGVERFM